MERTSRSVISASSSCESIGVVPKAVIDDAPRLAVGPFNDALMRADDMPFGVMPQACFQHEDHKTLRVDVQADGAVREAGRHGIAIAIAM